MNKKTLLLASVICLLALLLHIEPALAHDSVTIGEYEIEYGWLNEPAIAGQMNAFVVNISDTSGAEAQPVDDVSAFTVTVSYGGQTRALTLQPSGEDTAGQFVAPILPTIPGQYTLVFGGRLGDTEVSAEVEPEEVETVEALEFPILTSTPQNVDPGMINSLLYFSLLIGLIALILAVMALRKTR